MNKSIDSIAKTLIRRKDPSLSDVTLPSQKGGRAHQSQASRTYVQALKAAMGGGLGLSLMVAFADWSHLPVEAVPFTTSIVLVMAAPEPPPTPVTEGRAAAGQRDTHMVCSEPSRA